MTDSEVQKIRKSIVKHVNSNTQFCACISLVNIRYLPYKANNCRSVAYR
jgi:hypothetical protein